MKAVSGEVNPITGLLNFDRLGLQLWYVKPSFLTRWGPTALLIRAAGGRLPDARSERFHPQGYDLKTIGPDPQAGKGLEDMATTMEFLRTHDLAECPFTHQRRI